MLIEGTEMKQFTLVDQNGSAISLGSYRGHWVVLWWYPQASSESCTLEGRNFRRYESDFAQLGARLIGISFNTRDENREFAHCEEFAFPLLSDETWEVGREHGVVRDSSDQFAGKPHRITYLLAPDGKIARAYNVTSDEAEKGHVSQVLADLRELVGAGAAP